MQVDVDIRVLGLLSSRLCHELVNPLGAVNNGIELMLDVGDDMRDEALGLIENSAKRATERLRFYRMAYGAAGTSALGDTAAVRTFLEGLLDEGKVDVDWPEADDNRSLPEGWGRLLLNMAVAASEALPRGGTISVAIEDSIGAGAIAVIARGDRARIEESTRSVFFGDVPAESLEVKNVHGYFTSRLAASIGGQLQVSEPEPDEVRFETRISRA